MLFVSERMFSLLFIGFLFQLLLCFSFVYPSSRLFEDRNRYFVESNLRYREAWLAQFWKLNYFAISWLNRSRHRDSCVTKIRSNSAWTLTEHVPETHLSDEELLTSKICSINKFAIYIVDIRWIYRRGSISWILVASKRS